LHNRSKLRNKIPRKRKGDENGNVTDDTCINKIDITCIDARSMPRALQRAEKRYEERTARISHPALIKAALVTIAEFSSRCTVIRDFFSSLFPRYTASELVKTRDAKGREGRISLTTRHGRRAINYARF